MARRIIAAGLGPGDSGLLTAETLTAIAVASTVRLRTARHPAAAAIDAPSYDSLYESHNTFNAVYSAIVEDLVALSESNDVLYLVPGSPTVAESTVELLMADDRVECKLMPALSFVELAWTSLRIDPVAEGVQLIDGHTFQSSVAGRGGPFLVAQCSSRDLLSDIKLALDDPPESAILLHHLGLDDEMVVTVPWSEIDRTIEADHLTSLYVPALGEPVGGAVARFSELVRVLREQCPWDQKQTHGSLRRFLVEETYETIEALDAVEARQGDVEYEHLKEELGDLLFQIVFHAILANEAGQFTLDDVASGIHQKLVGRHPHVFGSGGEEPDVEHPSWDELKKRERADDTPVDILASIPPMPTLPMTVKITARAAQHGFSWPSVDGAWAMFERELQELHEATTPSEVEHEFGDVLFSLINLGRYLDVEADTALRTAITRFKSRFGELERQATADGVDMATADIADLLRRWKAAKRIVDV